jgi:hypothetical protein
MSLTFYIIFHKDLFPTNTAEFTSQEIKTIFTWVGVNEAIEKSIPWQMKGYPIIYEYKMRYHNPAFQKNNFYQNSVFFHLYRNQSYLKSKFIGFGQYDMKFQRNSIPSLLDDYVYGYFPYENEAIWNLFPRDFWQEVFLDEYNRYYATSHTFEDISKYPFFLYHTFIIPTSFFLHMMPFIEKSTDILLARLPTTRHIAGSLERVFALCIACGLVEGRLKGHMTLGGISHLPEQHADDPVRGIVRGRFSHS